MSDDTSVQRPDAINYNIQLEIIINDIAVNCIRLPCFFGLEIEGVGQEIKADLAVAEDVIAVVFGYLYSRNSDLRSITQFYFAMCISILGCIEVSATRCKYIINDTPLIDDIKSAEPIVPPYRFKRTLGFHLNSFSVALPV